MTYKLTIRETFEHTHHIEADSEAEAREKWEHVVVADYDGYGEDAIEREVSTLEALRPMTKSGVKKLRPGDRVRWVSTRI